MRARGNLEPPRCGICDRRCRDNAEVSACERGHDDDPCWKCGVVHGHALGCVFAAKIVEVRHAA